MKNLSFSQMGGIYAGKSEDPWLGIANAACTIWGVGRTLFGISISVACSPLTGVILTKLVDVACVGIMLAA